MYPDSMPMGIECDKNLFILRPIYYQCTYCFFFVIIENKLVICLSHSYGVYLLLKSIDTFRKKKGLYS